MGSLFNVVEHVHGRVVVPDARPDRAREPLVDPIYLVSEFPDQTQVGFAKQLLHVPLVGETECGAKIPVQTRIDFPYEIKVAFGQAG